MIGALALGQAADRWGRKPVLLGAILLFGLGSLATALANSVLQLGAMRLLTGFGLGGAIPIIIAIANEVAPRRIRTNVVAFMFCGFPLGSAVGGLIAAQMIPAWGWRSVFYLGGAVPLALVPLFAALTPESVRYLAARGRSAEAHRVLQRMGCAIGWNGLSPLPTAAAAPSLVNLFRAGRAGRTIRIWSTLFLSLLLTVFLVNWLPLLVRQSGLSLRTAVLTITALNLGGILGGFAIGRVCDRLASVKPIAAAYAAGGIMVALIGLAGRSDGLLMAATFVAGVLTVGAQMTAIALSAQLYENSLRTTGVGWAFGVPHRRGGGTGARRASDRGAHSNAPVVPVRRSDGRSRRRRRRGHHPARRGPVAGRGGRVTAARQRANRRR
jgi:AAHS family 4-hydroxybenzoate transporter-like MFS transporter